MNRWRIIVGHALDKLRELPDESVHCVVTSSPYYAVREYETDPQVWGGDAACEHDWGAEVPRVHKGNKNQGFNDRWHGEGSSGARKQEGGGRSGGGSGGQFCVKCRAWRGELGLENTPTLFVDHLVSVLREVKRVLRSDGVVWLNIGDSFYGGGHSGREPKDLCLVPERLAIALQEDGWIVRQRVTWVKGVSGDVRAGAAMPESVEDRPTNATETVWLLVKSAQYFYDHVAVQETALTGSRGSRFDEGKTAQHQLGRSQRGARVETGSAALRNAWFIRTQAFDGAHFAVMPTGLAALCIKAGTSARGACAKCGSPWVRVTTRETRFEGGSARAGRSASQINGKGKWAGQQHGEGIKSGPVTTTTTTGWSPSCECHGKFVERTIVVKARDWKAEERAGFNMQATNSHRAAMRGGLDHAARKVVVRERKVREYQSDLALDEHPTVPCVVLDPFAGAGTTGVASKELDRDFIGIELKPEYASMAEKRIRKAKNMKATEQVVLD